MVSQSPSLMIMDHVITLQTGGNLPRNGDLKKEHAEQPQANGIAESFMAVLVKVVHAAVVSNQDPRLEVRRRLMNYRNTPHPSTGKTPAELMIRRQIRTRVPVMMKSTTDKVDIEAKAMDKLAREKRKDRFDSRKHAKTKEVLIGDKVLV